MTSVFKATTNRALVRCLRVGVYMSGERQTGREWEFAHSAVLTVLGCSKLDQHTPDVCEQVIHEFFNDICIGTIIKLLVLLDCGTVWSVSKEKRDSPTLQVMDWICWIQDMATDKYYDIN